MIRPPGFRGAAFGDARDGDARSDEESRRNISSSLGITEEWAWMRQVHGAEVIQVIAPGFQGDADAAFTLVAGLPISVSTADCYAVILEADGAVGIAHAGWRGAAAGVLDSLRAAMVEAGFVPKRAAVGPGIAGCCFEVRSDVAAEFPSSAATTDWGTTSVDLVGAIRATLGGIDTWASGVCTMCGDGYNSYRRDGTEDRQVAVAWLPA